MINGLLSLFDFALSISNLSPQPCDFHLHIAVLLEHILLPSVFTLSLRPSCARVHFGLLFTQSLDLQQVVVELLKFLILDRLLLYTLLVPIFHYLLKGNWVVEILKSQNREIFELSHDGKGCRGEFAFTFREEQDFVGSFDELFLLWPQLGHCLDLLEHFLVLHPKDHHFVLQDYILQHTIDPRVEQSASVFETLDLLSVVGEDHVYEVGLQVLDLADVKIWNHIDLADILKLIAKGLSEHELLGFFEKFWRNIVHRGSEPDLLRANYHARDQDQLGP